MGASGISADSQRLCSLGCFWIWIPIFPKSVHFVGYLAILGLLFLRVSKWETELLPLSSQLLYYSKIFMCIHRVFIQNGKRMGKGRKMFLSQYHRPQMGTVPDLKSFRTSNHWGHFPGPFTLFIPPTPYYPTASLFSSWPSRLPPRSPTFFLFLFCKITSKVSGTNPLSLLVREESLQVRNPPSRGGDVGFKKHFFSSSLQ